MKPIKLALGERVIAVVPQRKSGPGWSNAPTLVYIETADEKLRTEWIQPNDRTYDLHILYDIGETVCAALIAAVPVKKAKR